MLKCNLCENLTFEDEGEAMEHIVSIHSDLCDEKLEEYVPDTQKEVYEERIEEVEED